MRKILLLLLLSLLLVGIAGILPSLIYSEWEWFSRSGALLIIVGAYFTWVDYAAEIKNTFTEERGRIKENTQKKYDLLKENSFGEIINPEYASSLIQKQNSKKLGAVASNEELKIKIYRRIEVFILVLGTLIWAYGDLLNKFICR